MQNYNVQKKILMKKLTFLCTLLCLTCVAEATLVIEEDFSLFTKGSPEQPDTENIAPGTNYVYEVDSAYTHTPNWSGYYVFQAGGCAAIGTIIMATCMAVISLHQKPSYMAKPPSVSALDAQAPTPMQANWTYRSAITPMVVLSP